MKRTFEITLPSFRWEKLITLRVLLIVGVIALSYSTFYWWRNIRPFFKVEHGLLCICSTELRCEETGRLLSCSLEEGEVFKRGENLFSFDPKMFVEQVKEMDRRIGVYNQRLEMERRKVDQGMQQYIYLQNELNLEGKTSELLEQILSEVQKAQETSFQMEQEASALCSERSEIEKQIGRKSVVADFEGVVLRRFKDAGDQAVAGEPILLVSNHQKRWVEAEIPEEMLLKIRVGEPAIIEFASFPKKRWNAQVSWISPAAKNGRLKIRITGEELPSYSGLSAKVYIKTSHAAA